MTSLADQIKEKSLASQYSEISKTIDEQPRQGEEVVDLDPSKVDPNPFQYRIRFNAETVEDLGKKIRRNGQMQPIGVRKAGDRYQIIWGEHRWRACTLEKLKVKAIIREAADEEMASLCFGENNDRSNPTAFEDYNAIAIQRRLGRKGKEIQEELGIRSQDFYKLLGFDNFPEPVLSLIKLNLDVIGKTEAEALGKLFSGAGDNAQKVTDVVMEAIDRFVNKNLPTRKAMLEFIQKELKVSTPKTHRQIKTATPAIEAKKPPATLLFEGKPVGTYENGEAGVCVIVSKEDLAQDKFEELQRFLASFFEIKKEG